MRAPARARSVALQGMATTVVEVEAAIGGGLPATMIVGLPDSSINEAKQRCRSAVASTGFEWPAQLLTINLSPATLPKRGSHYDLALVAATWAAQRIVPTDVLDRAVLLGELGLDGRVRAVHGLLAAVLGARDAGVEIAVVPAEQQQEAALVEGITVWGVGTLADLCEVLHGRAVLVNPMDQPPTDEELLEPAPDLSDVVGQEMARWALEVAAAGRHHLLLIGPPGCGKTMLAERLAGLLPELTAREAVEVASVRSMLETTSPRRLDLRPPFSAPHPSASVESVIGGGARLGRPGAVSSAHRGVLFLDEAPEFNRRALEALRMPLESGEVVIARAGGEVVFPASFQLVLAANPCPCGHYGQRLMECRCPASKVRGYLAKISGPVLDRIDIQQHLQPLPRSYTGGESVPESTAVVRERVLAARARQEWRLRGSPWRTNGEVPGGFLRRELPSPGGSHLLDAAVERGHLSGRGVDKVLRVAWTLADLDGCDLPSQSHVRAALAMRRGSTDDRSVA